MRSVARHAVLGLLTLAAPALAQKPAPATMDAGRNVPLPVQLDKLDRLHVTTKGRIIEDTARGIPFGGTGATRDGCPQVTTYTGASFTGGTYTAQGGFAESEIAACTYTLPAINFPLKITLMEVIVAQLNATVQTTTQWSILVWEGRPDTGTLVAEYSSDDTILPHIVMGPGTRGTNVQVSVDATDPDQIYIYNPSNLAQQTFTVGFRIDHHNSQTANPCFTAPLSNLNAFPCTDNTVIGCGSGYGQLNYPNDNWLSAVNCGANGCPPNGGWARFSSLQADQNIFGFCMTGCRPRGDWVMRVTWDPVNCPPPDGACCFGTAGCFSTNQAACQQAGGSWRGPGTTCGTFANGQFPGCVTPPNVPPVAVAGADQTLTDTNNNGVETIVVDGSGSYDTDGSIVSYRWSEGGTVLQDGPAFMSVSLPVGAHTLTLLVTDNQGATNTDTVSVVINGGHCPADLDDGSGTGTPDGGVDINDLLYFLVNYEAGNVAVDLDDGSGTGTPDGGVDINDLLFFLARYEGGC